MNHTEVIDTWSEVIDILDTNRFHKVLIKFLLACFLNYQTLFFVWVDVVIVCFYSFISFNPLFHDPQKSNFLGNIKFHKKIQLTWSIFLDFFQNKIIDDKSKGGALWSILCSILQYMLRIKKKNNERYRTKFFKIHFSSYD
jgi:hypothetical protein